MKFILSEASLFLLSQGMTKISSIGNKSPVRISDSMQSCLSCCFNPEGNKKIALRYFNFLWEAYKKNLYLNTP